ncbi:MAG: NusA antitermination factor [Candidatus Sulfotelmatobacter sp.]|nr:NusA antitermination factor [Candidatus Sulfotelmatobacter sp.]
MPENRKPSDASPDNSLERDPQLETDEQAQLDELGDDPAEVGARSAGQSGGSQGLSHIAEANEESVEELADTDQAFESAAVEGIEDAADHPERPTHTHEEYGRPDDVPPRKIA